MSKKSENLPQDREPPTTAYNPDNYAINPEEDLQQLRSLFIDGVKAKLADFPGIKVDYEQLLSSMSMVPKGSSTRKSLNEITTDEHVDYTPLLEKLTASTNPSSDGPEKEFLKEMLQNRRSKDGGAQTSAVKGAQADEEQA